MHTYELIKLRPDSGLRFWITDPNHSGAVNGLTDDFTGSHPWTPIDMDLTSGPQTHFLFIQLIRYPSRLFENKLGGTAWIGDVTLISSVGSTE